MVGRLLSLLALVMALLPLGATLARADDGPSRLLSATGPVRPPETIERLVNLVSQAALISVRGYASPPEDRRYWEPLFAATPELLHLDFGTDLGRYDTRGSIAANGAALREAVRRAVREEDLAAVTIVSVSMGGVVTGEALNSGLGARDNVTNWVTIGSPLNGSTTARAVRGAGDVAGVLGARAELAELIAPLGGGLDDPAMADLGASRRFTPPRGVRLVHFLALGDEAVLDADAKVPGSQHVRTLTPPPLTGLVTGIHAHGGQLKEGRTLAMVADAVRGQTVREHPLERLVTTVLAPKTDALRFAALLLLAVVFIRAAVLLSLCRRASSLVAVAGRGLRLYSPWQPSGWPGPRP